MELSVYFIHIFFIGPFLIYIGLYEPSSPYFYWVLLLLGTYIICKFVFVGVTTKWSERHVWFALHALFFGTLLLYVGYHGPTTPHVAFSLLLAIGIAAFGYHSTRFIQHQLSHK